jgi:glycosyltransferase involved in cell wall biosynthesis
MLPPVARLLRVRIPAFLRTIDPKTGTGNMWRHIRAGLAHRVDLSAVQHSRLPRLRRPPDVWLSDCGAGRTGVLEPIVVQVHEAGWTDDEVRRTLNEEFVEVVLEGRVGAAVREATRIITPSESSRRQIVAHWDLDPARVHAVPHGVDGDLFRPGRPGGAALIERAGGRADTPYVLFVSSIHPRKNLPVLRGAMTRLAAGGVPHQLALVAQPAPDRPDSDALEREGTADLPGFPGRVVHLRQLSDLDLATVYAGAAAFCLPSLMEGFGLGVLEAMSAGVPVVTSDRGALPEVVGDAGLVVEPTVDGVEEALGKVLADPTLAADLSAAGRERAAQFTWDKTVAGWLAVLRQASTEGGHRKPWSIIDRAPVSLR